MDITAKLIPISKYGESTSARRRGILLERVDFFVDHDTGNPNSTAQGNVNYFINTYNKESASAHIFIDDKDAIMCIPAFDNPERAHHVLYNVTTDDRLFGGDANNMAIGLELCYFPEDVERSKKAYDNYINVASDLCIFHNIDPSRRCAHYELDESRKVDPQNALDVIGLTYEQMKEDIINMTEFKKEPVKSWQQKMGEEAVLYLNEVGLINDPEEWVSKNLQDPNELEPWLMFELMKRLYEDLKGE